MEQAASFGSWLTEYRQGLHLQRTELAARIGCAVVTLRKIEMDERRPSREMAEQLAEQLAIPLEQRPAFVRVARGELSVNHLPLPRPKVAGKTNLPNPTTSLTGRSREIEEIKTLLTQPTLRLLTLTGAPGIGKTRLAFAAAATLQGEFPDGIFYVSLAPLTGPDQVLQAVAHSLQMGTTGRQPLLVRLENYLRHRQVLLVLDNFEHLLEAAPQLTRLLEATSQLKLLVTSRITLELSGEHRLIVMPLAVPPRQLSSAPGQFQTQFSAVDLFIKRAEAVKPNLALNEADLTAIGEICRKLDGLPLAIEFVAARAAYFTPQELLIQLGNHFPLKAGGSRDLPARHSSLWHALDWSYSLLSSQDQQLFRKLSVFVGGSSLDAVTAVCEPAPDLFGGITTLLNNSLLQRLDGDEASSRFEMLQTVREYALSQLAASGEAESVRQRHADYYLTQAQAAENAWDGPDEWKWLRRLSTERENLRATLLWAEETGNANLALRINAALFSFWGTSSSLNTARHWLETSLTLPVAPAGPDLTAVRAKVLNALGYIVAEMSDNENANRYFEQGLALYRELNEHRGIAWSLRGCALVEMQQDKYEAAGKLLAESLKLCEDGSDEWGWAWSLYALAFLKLAGGKLAEAGTSLEEALVHLRRQNMLFGIFRTLLALGYTVFEQGDVAAAEKFFREALLLNRETPLLTIITMGVEGLALVAARQGRYLPAARLWGAAEAMREISGQRILPAFQRTNEKVLDEARSHLDESQWAAAWTEGRTLTPTQALAEAFNPESKTANSPGLREDSILPL